MIAVNGRVMCAYIAISAFISNAKHGIILSTASYVSNYLLVIQMHDAYNIFGNTAYELDGYIEEGFSACVFKCIIT